MILTTANGAGFSRGELIAWFFAAYVFGGLLNLLLSVFYRLPFGGVHSIAVVTYMSTVINRFTLSELSGGYLMAGLIIFLLGWSGWFGKLLSHLPKPLLDAMLAGLILHFVINMFSAVRDAPLVSMMSMIGFLLAYRFRTHVPPLLGAIVFGGIALGFGSPLPVLTLPDFIAPSLFLPSFTLQGAVSISIPVAILILSNDVAVGLAALQKQGYRPPMDRTLLMTGIATTAASFFGAHSANIGGMMTVICSSDEAGPHDRRYLAGVVSAVWVILFGLAAWLVVPFIKILPAPFITLITGFSLIGILTGCLRSASRASGYRFSVIVCFLIAAFPFTILDIASPVWALLIGVLTAKLLGEGDEET